MARPTNCPAALALPLLLLLLTGCTTAEMSGIAGMIFAPQPVSAAIIYPAPSPALNCEARAEAVRRRYESAVPTRTKTTCNTQYGNTTCTSTTRPNHYADGAYDLELTRCNNGQ